MVQCHDVETTHLLVHLDHPELAEVRVLRVLIFPSKEPGEILDDLCVSDREQEEGHERRALSEHASNSNTVRNR